MKFNLVHMHLSVGAINLGVWIIERIRSSNNRGCTEDATVHILVLRTSILFLFSSWRVYVLCMTPLFLQQQLAALGGLQPGVGKLRDGKHPDATAIQERYAILMPGLVACN